MYRIPNTKILVLGGNLHDNVKVYFRNSEGSYEKGNFVKGRIQLETPESIIESTKLEISPFVLPTKLDFQALFKSIQAGTQSTDAVIEAAFAECLNMVRIELIRYRLQQTIDFEVRFKAATFNVVAQLEWIRKDHPSEFFNFRE